MSIPLKRQPPDNEGARHWSPDNSHARRLDADIPLTPMKEQ
jgi:hypothetical protein